MNDSSKRIIGLRIRRLREQRGLTRRQLAEASGLGESTLGCYELGTNYPKDVYLEKLAKTLRVRPETFSVCGVDTDIQLIHLLFNLEDSFDMYAKGGGEASMTADESKRLLLKALREWGDKRDELEHGEITEEQYREWKDTYYPFIQLDPYGEKVPDSYTGKKLEGKEREGAPLLIRALGDWADWSGQ